jgi:hypothetical protein
MDETPKISLRLINYALRHKDVWKTEVELQYSHRRVYYQCLCIFKK